jgi:hypothetical protein
MAFWLFEKSAESSPTEDRRQPLGAAASRTVSRRAAGSGSGAPPPPFGQISPEGIRVPKGRRQAPTRVAAGRTGGEPLSRPPTPSPTAQTLPPSAPARAVSIRSDWSPPPAAASASRRAGSGHFEPAACVSAPCCPILPVATDTLRGSDRLATRRFHRRDRPATSAPSLALR